MDDYSGRMVVGNVSTVIPVPDKFKDDVTVWFNLHELDWHHDSITDVTFIGFDVDSILVSEMNNEWFKDIKDKAKRFEEITGVPARLIGAQDIG